MNTVTDGGAFPGEHASSTEGAPVEVSAPVEAIGSAGESAAAWTRLRALHRDGVLAHRFDQVPALLAAMSGDDRGRSARILARLDPEEVRSYHPGLPRVRVAVTGSGTLDTLRTALIGELARHGFVPEVRLADFGTYVFELGDPQSGLYASRPDLTICVLDHGAVLDELPVPFTVDDVERVLAEKVTLWRRLAGRFGMSGEGILVLNTVPMPLSLQARLLDHPAKARLGSVWRAANAELLSLGWSAGSTARVVAGVENSGGTPAGGPRGEVAVVDLDPLLTTTAELTDPRFEIYTRANLADRLLVAYARELGHLVRARTGHSRKVLAIDLDHTLWGGVLGDDGVEGIEVAHGRKGEAFRRFQTVVKQLASQGVLVAAVSKNDQEAVLAALREHPDMVLREPDFVRILANWRPKPENVAALAKELNLGGDSVVFADDSAYECAAVKAALPETTVIHLDGDPALHTSRLLADGWFTVTEVTSEDRMRTRRYREESARTEFLSAAGSAADFLADLEISVRLAPAGEADIGRLSQLTLRTNQFNLTTGRLSPQQVSERVERADSRVLVISAEDRFGSNGTVGALLLQGGDPGELRIDNLLLSCRVFSRGIEQACLSAVLTAAREAGFRVVRASYRATAKNGKVKDFYPHYGFTVTRSADEATEFAHDLRTIPEVPGHLTLATEGQLVPMADGVTASGH